MQNITITVPTSKKDVKYIGRTMVGVGKRVIRSKEVQNIKLITNNWFNQSRVLLAEKLEKAANAVNIKENTI